MELAIIALAGILGTTVMIGVMNLIHQMKWANADMVRAMGSTFTRAYELSLLPGLIIHYSFGLFFAFAYATLIGYAPIQTPGTAIIISIFAGLVHGIIVGLMLEVLVAEHHPLKRFREAGFPVVAAHVIGHIFYGITIGMTFAYEWDRIRDKIQNFAEGSGLGEFIGYAFIWFPVFGVPMFYVGYLIYSYWVSEFREKAHQLEEDHEKVIKLSKVKLNRMNGKSKRRTRNGV